MLMHAALPRRMWMWSMPILIIKSITLMLIPPFFVSYPEVTIQGR
jgi:hypothetical protein